ncbi:hypothetical protein B0A49_00139 [Cryomyces minteri]|uniref:YDG domain-containing protein n=1 Tax=Cryomyces minteri TaxID=331657 RepID=A0A4U0XZM6_9PEZI|nr:hypothetical protein B0A49_00139 [Cryomyces minteri]
MASSATQYISEATMLRHVQDDIERRARTMDFSAPQHLTGYQQATMLRLQAEVEARASKLRVPPSRSASIATQTPHTTATANMAPTPPSVSMATPIPSNHAPANTVPPFPPTSMALPPARTAPVTNVARPSTSAPRAFPTPRTSAVANTAQPPPPASKGIPAPTTRQPPDWYLSMKASNARDKRTSDVSTRLVRVRDHIKSCKTAQNLPPLFNSIRLELHVLPFLEVTATMLRNARLLFNDDGLPQLFDDAFSNGVQYPWDIKADAQELYQKWACQDFDTNLLRGIRMGKPKSKNTKYAAPADRSSDAIEPGYPGRVPANYFGHGTLINGQWWPTQLCTLRDGAHGASQGGIYGEHGRGTFSIVLSGGSHYADEDRGDDIWYCGTDSKDGGASISDGTQLLITSTTTKNPVRVLRSANLSAANPFRPLKGFRYDGLYTVLDYAVQDLQKQVHRFHLRRCPGQDPLRFRGVERRPTSQEVEAMEKNKELRGF